MSIRAYTVFLLLCLGFPNSLGNTPLDQVEGRITNVLYCNGDTTPCPMWYLENKGQFVSSTLLGMTRSRRVRVKHYSDFLGRYIDTDEMEKEKKRRKLLLLRSGISAPEDPPAEEDPPPKEERRVRKKKAMHQAWPVQPSPPEILSRWLNEISIHNQPDQGNLNLKVSLTIKNVEAFDMATNRFTFVLDYEITWLDRSIYYFARDCGSISPYIPCVAMPDWNSSTGHITFETNDAPPTINDMVWMPRIHFVNQIDQTKDETYSELYRTKVYDAEHSREKGYNVSWQRIKKFTVSCTISSITFPFDAYTCPLGLRVANMSYDRVNFDVNFYEIPLNHRMQWSISALNYSFNPTPSTHEIGNANDKNAEHSDIEFRVKISRSGVVVVNTIILPTFEMLTISYIAFHMNIRSQDRINMSLTVILPFYIVVSGTLAFLPQSSAKNNLQFIYFFILVGCLILYTVVHTTIIAGLHCDRDLAEAKYNAEHTVRKRSMNLRFYLNTELDRFELLLRTKFGLEIGTNKNTREPSIEQAKALVQNPDEVKNSTIELSMEDGLKKMRKRSRWYKKLMKTMAKSGNNFYKQMKETIIVNMMYRNEILSIELYDLVDSYMKDMNQLASEQLKTNTNWQEWNKHDMQISMNLLVDAALKNEEGSFSKFICDDLVEYIPCLDQVNDTLTAEMQTRRQLLHASNEIEAFDVRLLNPRKHTKQNKSTDSKDLFMALLYPALFLLSLYILFLHEVTDMRKNGIVMLMGHENDEILKIVCIAVVTVNFLLWATSIARALVFSRMHFVKFALKIVGEFRPVAKQIERDSTIRIQK